jgi:integrase
MAVRKRIWKTSKGEFREKWIVDYIDKLDGGKRRLKTFERKKDALEFAATSRVEVREGVHVADSASIAFAQAGKLWLETAERRRLERSTRTMYRQQLDLHIAPFIGGLKLSQLSVPRVREFEDELARAGRSQAMIRKVRVSLSSLISDAMERGLVNRNVVRDLRARRNPGKERQAVRRLKGKLKVGVDIPSNDEIRAFVNHLEGRWRPVLLTAVFTGLRASELRGLRWSDIDLVKGELHVRQRADRYLVIGPPKSESGERTIPLLPIVVNALKEHKIACPKNDLGLAFPSKFGMVEHHSTLVHRGLAPAMIKAGVVDEHGGAKYTGLHSLRHWFASWCINRRADGGLELPAKVVQGRLGHSNIAMTLDTYGHLFERGDDTAELAMAERLLLR